MVGPLLAQQVHHSGETDRREKRGSKVVRSTMGQLCVVTTQQNERQESSGFICVVERRKPGKKKICGWMRRQEGNESESERELLDLFIENVSTQKCTKKCGNEEKT